MCFNPRLSAAVVLLAACGTESTFMVTVEESASCDGMLQAIEGSLDAPFDVDGDGAFDESNPDCVATWSAENLDCDDSDPEVHPGAEEVPYDGVDNDCDELTPDDDLDGDGFGYEEDCLDDDPDVHPDAEELCNGVDDDCDGMLDEVAELWFEDGDGDGFGDPEEGIPACEQPEGTVADDTDCDDEDATVHPDASEVCNGVDDNCDGSIPGDETTDSDGDGTVDCEDEIDGYALEFDGGDQIAIPGTENEHLTSGFTVELWLCTTTIVTDLEPILVSKHEAGSYNGWFVSLDWGSWSTRHTAVFYLQGTRIAGGPSLNDGMWHHAAATYDGAGGMNLYVDGSWVAGASQSYSSTNAQRISMGSVDGWTCPACLEGTLDEVSVWSTARGSSEIVEDMAAQLAGDEEDLWAWWPFSEGTGQTFADWSGNGRDGVLGATDGEEDSDPSWVEDGPF